MTTRKPRKARPPRVSLGGIVKEELPIPYVHYPRHYGTFFAFSATENSEPYLCECSLTAIVNFIELQKFVDKFGFVSELHDGHFHSDQILPKSLSSIHITSNSNPNHLFKFKKRLCHRCNLSPPTMRYCHEMYGVRFIQYFGWYINQAYLRFGILPQGTMYLKDITPEELIIEINKILKARIVLSGKYQWFKDKESYNQSRLVDPRLPDLEFTDDEIGYRKGIFIDAQKRERIAVRSLSTKIENIVREEFGFKKVGERWTSETLLYYIVCKILRDTEVLRHYRPEWLEGLELDIFIPSLNLAFEYQGQQHFHPIKVWGGEEALLELQKRDKRKAKICDEKGVHLITVDYSEPLIQDYINMRIKSEYDDKSY